MIHKKIDINSKVPVDINCVKKTGLIVDLVSSEKNIVIESKKLKTSYMIFAFQKVYEDFGIDYETIVVLSYLNELTLFSIRLSVQSRNLYLMDYIKLGLIKKDNTIKHKSLYRLTEKSLNIVNKFNYIIENPDSFIEKNREADLDVDSKVSNALEKYFNN